MQGTIPQSLGELSKLERCRLSFNAFVGVVPNELGNLSKLELVQLQGNRLEGEVPVSLNVYKTSFQESSFISDCGVPTDFDEPLLCDECTMCCNNAGDCHSTEPARLEQVPARGFSSYAEFIWVFLLLLIGYCMLIVAASILYDLRSQRATARRPSVTMRRDKKYALDTIGQDSVYSFYLTTNWKAWTIALAVLAIQIAALTMFVKAAVKDFSDDRSDFIYSFKCPRNNLYCTDESDLTWQGWCLFGILMAAHLLRDIINGIKLLILSGKRRHSNSKRVRYLLAGFFLTWISMFTLYASTVYNIAIARSDTDIIINTVVILFICDIDEYFYAALVALSSLWKTKLIQGDEFESNTNGKMEKRDSFDDVDNNTRDAQIDMLIKSNDDLKKRLEALEKLMLSSVPKEEEKEEDDGGFLKVKEEEDDNLPLVHGKQDTCFTSLNN